MPSPHARASQPFTSISISRLALAFNAFVVIGILAVAAAAGLAIDSLRIGGSMYDQIVSSKNLVADILPPPLYVIEAYQEVTRLENAPDDHAQRVERLALLRKQYADRRTYWEASSYPANIKRKLTVDSDREAQAFWSEIESGFLPALRDRDAAKMRQSYATITGAYDAHRKIVDDIVTEANAVSAQVEQVAERQKYWYFVFMAGTIAAALGLALFALYVMRARVTHPLVALAEHLKDTTRQPTPSHVPFSQRPDEIGTVAQAIEAFRFDVEQRVLEEKNAQLDGALNNIVQGVEMYDAEGRLVLCNARYKTIYGMQETDVPAGATLRDVVARRVASGLLSRDAADALCSQIERARLAPSERDIACLLEDGRCVAIAVQPMRNGGFVATHADVTEQRRNEAKIAYFAHHDALTALPNRIKFNDELERALAYARRGELVAVHIVDLDRFKPVNDSLGHPAGDRLLGMVADRLRSELRETDRIGRMGGDEFAIVERQISEPADAVALANRVIALLSEPYDLDGHRVTIGASVGIAVSPQDGTTAEDLLRNADLALYRAKREGRRTFRFFEPAMDAQMQARATLERELRDALALGQFELHYQPIIAAQSNEVCSFEALLRWRHPAKGLISPAAFIPLAEESRLIVPIGAWVLREACAAAMRWPAHIKVAVNLSAAQFRSGDVGRAVADALDSSGLAPNRLELEITESLLLEADAKTMETLHHLRGLGAHITLDDFGTGYSSLAYLQSFPFDKIKIDKSFVQGIEGHDGRSLKIVRAVTTLADGLGMKTTAEGVESNGQLEAVRSEGCTEIQGFLMSKPLKIADVELMLRMLPGGGEKEGDVKAA